MPRIVKVNVPERDKAVFANLMQMSPREIDALVESLSSATPALSNRDLLVQVIANEHLKNQPNLDRVMRMLVGVSRTIYAERLSIENVVNDLLEQVKAEEIIPLDGVAEELRSRLKQLFSVRTLEITAKAAMIMTSHEHVYDSARVMTEFRPIFTGGENLEIAAGVIMHELQITTHSNGDQKTLFVALDYEDLEMLRSQLERAIRKEIALKSAEERAGTTVIASS